MADGCWVAGGSGWGAESHRVCLSGTSVLQREHELDSTTLLSAIGPATTLLAFHQHHPRRKHFADVHVTAKADEVIAALQVVLPAAEARIVAEVIVAGKRLGKFAVVAADKSACAS